MDKSKMMEYAMDLRADLKYAFEQGEGQTPNHKDVLVMDWLIEQARKVREYEAQTVGLEGAVYSIINEAAKSFQEFEKTSSEISEHSKEMQRKSAEFAERRADRRKEFDGIFSRNKRQGEAK